MNGKFGVVWLGTSGASPQRAGGGSFFSSAMRRRAYTLLELLLVMAVMLVLVGMAWSGMQGIYQRHQLREAAESVRIRLTKARLQAIDSGWIYQFRFEPGGRAYQVTPLDSVTSSTSTGPDGQLPESMRFEPVRDTSERVGQTAAINSAGAWSDPILFAPDGSSNSSAFDVVDRQDRSVRLSVRGLTAAVSTDTLRRRTSS